MSEIIKTKEEPEQAAIFEKEQLKIKIYDELLRFGVRPQKLKSGLGEIADLEMEDGPDVWERITRPFIVVESASPDPEVQVVYYKARIEPDPRNSLKGEVDFYGNVVEPIAPQLQAEDISVAKILKSSTESEPPYFIMSEVKGETCGSIHQSDPSLLTEADMKKVIIFHKLISNELGKVETILPKTDRIESYEKTISKLDESNILTPYADKMKKAYELAVRLIDRDKFEVSVRDLNPSNIIKGDNIGFIDFERNCLSNSKGYDFSFLMVSMWNNKEAQLALKNEVEKEYGSDVKNLLLIDLVLFRIPGEINYWRELKEKSPQDQEKAETAEKILNENLEYYLNELNQE